MALTEIEYGSLASSDVMNKNFEYLDNKISDVSENLASNVATINANIATANTSISTLSDSINKSIEELGKNITSKIEENGLFITTYINGTSWYREYFRDAEKTERVWLVQGGITYLGSTNAACDVVLLKPFETPLVVLASPASTSYNAGGGVTYGTAAAYFVDKTKIHVTVAAVGAAQQHWVAYGN